MEILYWAFELCPAKDVQASADFFWNLDTRGYVSQQLRQTKREQELEIEQLRLDSEALIDRLLAAQKRSRSLVFY